MKAFKKYDYLVLYIGAIISFFAAALSKDHTMMHFTIGTAQVAMGIMLMKKSKKA